MCNFGQRSVCLKTLVLPRGSCPGKFTQKIPFLRYKGLVLHSPEAVYAQNNVLHFPEEVYSHNNFSHSSSLKALMLHSPETADGDFV